MKAGYLLALLLVLFLAVRLIVLFTSFDLTDLEEPQNGTLGIEILHGASLPLLEYLGPPEGHEGGLVVNGLLAAISFAVFGIGGTSLKLVWLLYSLGAFCLFLLVVNRGYGRRAMVLTGLFATFSPPFFTFMNLTDTTVDTGALFCSMLILYLTVRMIETNAPSHFGAFLVAVACGFGPFFSYHTLPMIAACFLAALILKPRRIIQFFPTLVLGGLCGLSPWLYFNITHDFWGLLIFKREMVFSNEPVRFGRQLLDLITADLFYAPGFSDLGLIKWYVMNVIYYISLTVALAIVVFRVFFESKFKNSAALLLLLFPVVWVIIYSANPVKISHEGYRAFRHMLPLFIFFFAFLGVAADRLLAGVKGVRIFAMTLVALPVLCGMAANARMISVDKDRNTDSIYRAGLWPWLAFKVGSYADNHPHKAKKIIFELNQKYAPYDYDSANLMISDVEVWTQWMENLTEDQRKALFHGIGEGLGRYGLVHYPYLKALGQNLPSGMISIGEAGVNPGFQSSYEKFSFDHVRKLPPNHLVRFCRGIGMASEKPESVDIVPSVCANLKQGVDSYREGIGIANWQSTPADSVFQESLYRGMGIGAGIHFSEEANTLSIRLDSLPEQGRTPYLEGIGIALGWHLISDPTLRMRTTLSRHGSLRATDLLVSREYSYLPEKILEWVNSETAVKHAYLFGLGKGLAVHLDNTLRFIFKVYRKVALDSTEQQIFRNGLQAGRIETIPDSSSAIKQMKNFVPDSKESELFSVVVSEQPHG